MYQTRHGGSSVTLQQSSLIQNHHGEANFRFYRLQARSESDSNFAMRALLCADSNPGLTVCRSCSIVSKMVSAS